MDAAAIAKELRGSPRTFPKKALKGAVAAPAEVAPGLIRLLEETLADARRGDLPVDAGPLHAMFLLAQFRETAALPVVLRLFSLPGDDALEIVGEVFDHDLHRILASLARGDARPIERLVEDRKVHPMIRACGVEALCTMVLVGEAERDHVIAFCRRLLDGGLERRAEEVWEEIVGAAATLHPGELIDGIRRAVAEGILAPDNVVVREVEGVLLEDPAKVLERSRSGFPGLIQDAVGELRQWFDQGAFEVFIDDTEMEELDDTEDEDDLEAEPVEQFRHDRPPPGRNDPCPCGSGKKYKKCCGRT